MKTLLQNKHYVYLLLAIAGGGYTFYYAMLGVIEHQGNFNTLEFITSTWTESSYARSLTLDFWTAAVAGTLFIIFEARRLKMKYSWVYVLLTFGIAFAFGFPLFLFMRGRLLKKTNH
jgi:hypothetical protein